VGKIDGTADVFNGIVIAGPSVSIEPDYARLAQFGLTPAALQYQMQTSLEGNIVGTLPEKEQMTNIRMVYPGSRRLSVADIGQHADISARRTAKTYYRPGHGHC
jgi:Cu/Ag efflux pump CusA